MQWAKQKQAGFTIVELLIVVVVIAILAAITIVAYNGIQTRAKQAAAQSSAAQASKKAATYAIQNADLYPSTIEAMGLDPNTYQYSVDNESSPRTFCITATKSNVSYYTSETISNPTEGACPGHAANGGAVTANLVANPKAALTASSWSQRISSGGSGTGSRISGLTPMGGTNITTGYRLTLTATPSSWWRVSYYPADIVAGEMYTFSGFVRPSVAASTGAVIIWKNGTTTVSENSGPLSAHSSGVWSRRSVTATAPSGATTAWLEITSTSVSTVGATLDVTGLYLEKSSQVNTYSDGDSVNWGWSGPKNNSVSTGPPL